MSVNRRAFVGMALAGLTHSAFGLAGESAPPVSLVARARALIDVHSQRVLNRQYAGIADFGLHSSMPRFHLVDLATGTIDSCLVAHGRGSDPTHTGWLEHFSNALGSYATAQGCYLTDGEYLGMHGRSMRLLGLEPANDNASRRGIVVHGASYVSESMIEQYGKVGRSEGCLAVSNAVLDQLLNALRPGSLILAAKL